MTGLLITVGEILVEIMATTIGTGFRTPQNLVGPFPSGAPAIFIDQAGRLGAPCAMIGAVGDDDFGRVNLDRLSADGVDVSAVAVHSDIATGSAFVRYRADGNRDFVFNIRHSASGRIAMTPEAEQVIARASRIHVMGSALTIPPVRIMVERAVATIKANGGLVSFDPNVRKEMMNDAALTSALHRILAATDLFLPSGDEILLFSQASDRAGGRQAPRRQRREGNCAQARRAAELWSPTPRGPSAPEPSRLSKWIRLALAIVSARPTSFVAIAACRSKRRSPMRMRPEPVR